MSTTRRRFSQEFKDELCREVIETSKPIRDVAEAYGVGSESLRRWLIKYRQEHGTEPELSVSERARLRGGIVKFCGWRVYAAWWSPPDWLGVCGFSSTANPLTNWSPARTLATRWRPLMACHRSWAVSMSLKAIAMPAARDPGPLVTR